MKKKNRLFGLNLGISREWVCILGSKVLIGFFLPFLVHGLWNVSVCIVCHEQSTRNGKSNEYTLVNLCGFLWSFHWLSWTPGTKGDVPCSLLLLKRELVPWQLLLLCK